MTPDRVDRRVRAWLQALSVPGLGAVTGRWEQAATHAEHPERGAWDRQRPDGSWHLPWAVVHTTPCPGGPWAARPDRWTGPLRCGAGHWHTRTRLGLQELR